MNISLKNKFVKVLNRSKLVPLSEDSPIKYCIDVSAKYKNDNLIIRGWCLDGVNDVSVSVTSKDGSAVYLVKEIRELRNDVLQSNGLEESNLKSGFFNIYDIEHVEDELFINFKSSDHELSVPLIETPTSIEQLELAWDELHKTANNVVPIKNKLTLEVDDTELLEQKEKDSLSIPNVENSIKHYVERVGVYKNKVLLVRGWCADIERNSDITINITNGVTPLRVLKKIRRSRKDVSLNLGLKNEKIKHGFLFLVQLASAEDKDLMLHFEMENKPKKVAPINEIAVINKEELVGNLIDSQAFTGFDAKMFLINALGRTYLSDMQSELVDISSMSINLYVDDAFTINTGCFLRGWLDDFSGELSAICLSDGSIISDNLLPNLIRKARNDVNDAFAHLPSNYKSGFFCYAHLGQHNEPVYLLLFSKSGRVARVEIDTKPSENNEVIATKHILADFDPYSVNASEIYQHQLAPSLLGVWDKRTQLPENQELKIWNYGEQIEHPVCTIIVPLYGRYDFVLHQISQFESDPDFKDIELIYVVDDPSIEAETKAMCNDIVELYNTCFKVVSYGRNLGYAGANNVGAQIAKGKYLLLLNSDIIPSQSGWLTRMLQEYKSIDDIGALGVKLVFEDESIQHMGMSFVKNKQFDDIWLNDHPFKGLPSALTPEVGLKAVSTVTAACLLIEKSKFNEVGKLDTSYILGDFEDSDLCLKLIDSGYQNYILGSEKLYHLERQSQSLVDAGDWKFKLTLFNGWQHSQRWNQLIKQLQA